MRRVAATLLAAVLAACAPADSYDIVIRNGLVYDGTGRPPRRADVGITGDRIRAIGALDAAAGRAVIDASGKAVAPGFIDPLVRQDEAFVRGGAARHFISQGVTTAVLVVSDAVAPGGRAAYLDQLRRTGTAANVATLSTQTSAAQLGQDLQAGAVGLWLAGAAAGADGLPPASLLAPSGAALVVDPQRGETVQAEVQSAIDLAAGARLEAMAVAAELRDRPADQVADLANVTRRMVTSGLYTSLIVEPSALPRREEFPEQLRSLLGWGEMMPTAAGDPAAFPRWLRATVGEGLLTLEEAIRRATSQPAVRLGLGPRGDRGELREGAAADVVVFDPAVIGNNTSAGPAGFAYVLVNGVPVVAEGAVTGARPGVVINGRTFPRPGGN